MPRALPTFRTFTCKLCGAKWVSEAKGNFTKCAPCKEAEQVAKRTKVCLFCKESFTDTSSQNSQSYCNVECRRRGKVTRTGNVPEEGFLADRVLSCQKCQSDFTPTAANQIYCTDDCRLGTYAEGKEASRVKICKDTGEAFVDRSLKNNRQFTDQRSRERANAKTDPTRPVLISPRLEEHRRYLVRAGGGRMDDISTLRKYTNSWWGRASEIIFSKYRPKARDLVAEFSNRSPHDFEDEEFGRIEARGVVSTVSSHGRLKWSYVAYGLNQSCDHVFFVGYSNDRKRVERLWLIPASEVPDTSIRFSPSSSEYRWEQYDITSAWGLLFANETLKELHAMPEPEALKDRFAWMDDPSQFANRQAPGHRGRLGEFIYRGLYPASRDMNRELGPNAPHDFEDPDGTRVNAKASKLSTQGKRRWSFAMGDSKEHKCDVYACLCLAEDERTVLAEYRIPAEVWGNRRGIHIYRNGGGQWEVFRRSSV